MARTYRTSKLAAAGLLPHDRIIKEASVRNGSRPMKRLSHHRNRRQCLREIILQMEEAL